MSENIPVKLWIALVRWFLKPYGLELLVSLQFLLWSELSAGAQAKFPTDIPWVISSRPTVCFLNPASLVHILGKFSQRRLPWHLCFTISEKWCMLGLLVSYIGFGPISTHGNTVFSYPVNTFCAFYFLYNPHFIKYIWYSLIVLRYNDCISNHIQS